MTIHHSPQPAEPVQRPRHAPWAVATIPDPDGSRWRMSVYVTDVLEYLRGEYDGLVHIAGYTSTGDNGRWTVLAEDLFVAGNPAEAYRSAREWARQHKTRA